MRYVTLHPAEIRAILSPAMKLLFGLVVLLLVIVSLVADYHWKRWIAARKQERDDPSQPK